MNRYYKCHDDLFFENCGIRMRLTHIINPNLFQHFIIDECARFFGCLTKKNSYPQCCYCHKCIFILCLLFMDIFDFGCWENFSLKFENIFKRKFLNHLNVWKYHYLFQFWIPNQIKRKPSIICATTTTIDGCARMHFIIIILWREKRENLPHDRKQTNKQKKK